MRILSYCIAALFIMGCQPKEAAPPADTPAEPSFVSVFNGENLDGWTGDLDGYTVEDGAIVCIKEKGGNIYIDQPYSDFVFRFEFQLEPGGNNGLGIRAEQGKDAAYHGMEIQILDNDHPDYAELEAYQYHGSIYGVAAAERGHLKPTGEWNVEEVRADGSRITVTLNGHVIVDADLEEVGRPETIDGREHPGLFNASGYVGFLGHGHRVAFRNLEIMEL